MSGLDQDVLRHAISTAREHGFRTVKLRVGDEKFRATLGEVQESSSEEAMIAQDMPLELRSSEPQNLEVTAPVVGYFRQGKVPLEAGRVVETGEALCEIIALGIANDVIAKGSGEIVEVMIESGEAVEYGQVLATVRTK